MGHIVHLAPDERIPALSVISSQKKSRVAVCDIYEIDHENSDPSIHK